MVAVLFRFFLVLVALSLAVAVFLVQQEIDLLAYTPAGPFLPSPLISYAFYFLFCFLCAYISIKLARFLDTDTIAQGTIRELEQAGDIFLPSYLGYFFVALSVPAVEIFILVFGIIAILIFCSRAAYFNPLYFLLGYRFYSVITSSNVKLLLITKRRLKEPCNVEFEKIKRINDFTFIEAEHPG